MSLQVEQNAFPHPQGRLLHPCNPWSASARSPSPSLLPSPVGVPATWLVFIPFASAIGAYWAPILYCITVTTLEVVFSLGTCLPLLFLSHIDPPSARHDMEDESSHNAAVVLCRTDRDHRSMLPRSHWHMRMLYLGLVSNGIQAVPFSTGVGVVRDLLPYLLDMKAKIPHFSALLWRRAYYLFVVVVPLLTFTAFLVAVLKTDSVHPASDLHCDITSPLWYVRLSSSRVRFASQLS
jgi:hypothetical protein